MKSKLLSTDNVIHVSPRVATDIYETTAQAIVLAQSLGVLVELTFNEIKITVTASTSPQAAVATYFEKVSAKYETEAE